MAVLERLKPRGRGGGTGFQVTGMIEWSQKSRPKKSLGLPAKPKRIPGPKSNIQKNPMPILWPLKVPERGNAITQRKTFWKLNTRLTRLLQSFMFHASASFKVRRTSI